VNAKRDEETKRRRNEVKEKENIPTSSTSSLRLSVSTSLALLCCAALLTLFALTSWHAWLLKCATVDEPGHLVSAWLQTHDGDFRCDPESMALWKYYLALGTRDRDLKLDRSGDSWTGMLSGPSLQWAFIKQAMYLTPGNDADALIRAGRARMLVLGVLLGALVAWWAWRLRGPRAGVAAAAAFCLDPNFLAHSPLIKNDVAITLLFFALAAAVWLTGERATLGRSVAVALLLGAATNTKFSGLFAIPILGLMLLARALSAQPWPLLKWTARNLGRRLAVAAAIFAFAILISYPITWACYGFRYRVARGQDFSLNDTLTWCADAQTIRDHKITWDIPPEQLLQWASQWQPDLIVRAAQAAFNHHLLPQAFVRGFIYTYASSAYRPSFLCGRLGFFGWWYYFPLAFAFKTPLATLIALALATATWLGTCRSRLRRLGRATASPHWWPFWAAVITPVFYMAMAMSSHVNLGLRLIFPVYPFLFVFLGVAAADAFARVPRTAAWIVPILALGLAVETFFAYPDFLPFFNVAAGGARGGVRLLGDSNLDWGQDLPALRDWQKLHPDRQLALCYFGTADPRYYGIHYVNLPGSQAPQDLPLSDHDPAIVAISATTLQGLEMPSAIHRRYQLFLRGRQPIAILGGSIYLYEGR
jgi:hypothetical protein